MTSMSAILCCLAPGEMDVPHHTWLQMPQKVIDAHLEIPALSDPTPLRVVKADVGTHAERVGHTRRACRVV